MRNETKDISGWIQRAVLAAALSIALSACRATEEPHERVETAPPTGSWVNSLGMAFRPVPGTDVKLSVFETRVRDFEVFAAETGYDHGENLYHYNHRHWARGGRSWKTPGFLQDGDFPVGGISWHDANAFCRWLTGRDRAKGVIRSDQVYRLPTDYEWSRAAGSPNRKALPEGNYHPQRKTDTFDYTSPAGYFSPNENGFYDMGGNVWEFCLDADGYDRSLRVIRGGSWLNWHNQFVGPDARGRCNPDVRIMLYGFRVALAPADGLTAANPRDEITPPPGS